MMSKNRGNCDLRSGLTVLELLIAVAIIGMLIGLLLPAIVAAREITRQMVCSNNLRGLGTAVQQHHDAQQVLPSAWKNLHTTTTVYGWAVSLLPFMDCTLVENVRDLSQSLTSQSSRDFTAHARQTSLGNLLCPSDLAEPSFALYLDEEQAVMNSANSLMNHASTGATWLTTLPTANYVGVFGTLEPDDDFPPPIGDGAIIAGQDIRFADLRRGLAKTLLVGERTMAKIPATWLGVDLRGEDATCRLVGSAITQPNCHECDECEFASRHQNGVNFVWGDGHVSSLGDQMDSATYREFARRQLPPFTR